MALAETVVSTLPALPRPGPASTALLARDRSLPVLAAVRELLPEGLRRGSVTAVAAGPGATALAMAVAAGASAEGSWVAVVGAPSWGLCASTELGVAPERLLVVPEPVSGAGTSLASVVAALVDAVDVIVLGARVAAVDARRLAARARERGAVLLALPGRWPQASDVTLSVTSVSWELPHRRLAARRVEVVATGRGAAARERRSTLWLPGPDGAVASCGTTKT